MVNINKLKGKIVESGLTVGELAQAINIDKTTLYRRMGENGDRFLIKEVNAICKKLNLTKEEAIAIFFNNDVASNANDEQAACKEVS